MDRAYLECCSSFSSRLTNWNDAYQLALEMEGTTSQQAVTRQAEIYRVEKWFEAEIQSIIRHLLLEDPEAPRQLPRHHHCYCEGNVFLRVFPDCRSGRNYVASLRGVIQSSSRRLTVPLACMVVFRGIPVLAQALVHLPPGAPKLHGSGVAPNAAVAAEMSFIADALNIPLPVHPLLEVYEGCDGRWYVTRTNITTIPLDDSALLNSPVKRQEMLVLCGCVTSSCDDTLRVLKNPSVVAALEAILSEPPERQQQLLCDTLHFYGVNLCLLKGVADALRIGSSPLQLTRLLPILAVEMLARTVKQNFYLKVQAKDLGMDDVDINKCFAVQLHSALDTGSTFLASLMRKYAIANYEGGDSFLVAALKEACEQRRQAIVERVSILIGARSVDTDGTGDAARRTISWAPRPPRHVYPRLSDPSMIQSLDVLYRGGVTTNELHEMAFCLPIRVRAAMWESRWGDALHVAQETAQRAERRHGPDAPQSLEASRMFCRLLFRVPSIENVREGCALLIGILERYAAEGNPIVLARMHIDAGCWMLTTIGTVDLVAEAAMHFAAAEQLIPGSMCCASGAWLHVQPRLGQLRCRKMLAEPQRVPVQALADDALLLAKVVIPADYFVEYLWELGMELAVDRSYEQAAKILTAAVGLCKKVGSSHLNLAALQNDTLGVYRAWDPDKYSAYCDAFIELQA